ncbi:uncharacterized protein LOC110698971 [Chenopodium quinoa]|uniref:uncharacterized protein LOC110698971 n=1 Tax=Chenopodium quinoa TaxID=63459 RepID=UPI000B77FB87|nr:uncharacterized protein LOC110698971 [Chenopodium quinoa]
MRLQVRSSHLNLNKVKEFLEWILRIGDGKEGEPNDGETIIKIPDDILIKDEVNSPVASIVESVYLFISHNLDNTKYFQERAILVPTNECVEVVNEHLLSIIPGEEKIYLSSDNICASDRNVRGYQELYTPNFLNSINCSGLPNHTLKLKIGVQLCYLEI